LTVAVLDLLEIVLELVTLDLCGLWEHSNTCRHCEVEFASDQRGLKHRLQVEVAGHTANLFDCDEEDGWDEDCDVQEDPTNRRVDHCFLGAELRLT